MALSLNLYIYFSLCLTHMACFLHVHTSSVTTKVAPYKGLVRPQARQLRMKQGEVDMARMRGAQERWWGLALSLRHLLFFHTPFFPILHFLCLSLPSVKSCLGAFSTTKGRGKKTSVALSSSHHPFHPSTRPCVFTDKMCVCVCLCVCEYAKQVM